MGQALLRGPGTFLSENTRGLERRLRRPNLLAFLFAIVRS